MTSTSPRAVTFADVVPGAHVGPRIVTHVIAADVPGGTRVHVTLTGPEHVTGWARDVIPAEPGTPGPQAFAEYALHLAEKARRAAWEAWNATLPELPDVEGVRLDLDDFEDATCPHEEAGEVCGAGLSVHYVSREHADVTGYGNGYDGRALFVGEPEDAQTEEVDGLSCFRGHLWRVVADRITSDSPDDYDQDDNGAPVLDHERDAFETPAVADR